MKKWIISKPLKNGLYKYTCPDCGYEKEIMHATRDWTKCENCGAALWTDKLGGGLE